MPDNFEEPEIIPEEEYHEWICDSKFRDQICILTGAEVNIYWFSHLERELIFNKKIDLDSPALKQATDRLCFSRAI